MDKKESLKDVKEASIKLVFGPVFDEWTKEKDLQVQRGLDEIRKIADQERLKLSEAQARHMAVVEEFLKIQTEIFNRLEKKLK